MLPAQTFDDTGHKPASGRSLAMISSKPVFGQFPVLPTLPANLCPLSRVPISRGLITHALYATFRFRAQAQSNSM